jgi:hypothetical protein
MVLLYFEKAMAVVQKETGVSAENTENFASGNSYVLAPAEGKQSCRNTDGNIEKEDILSPSMHAVLIA